MRERAGADGDNKQERERIRAKQKEREKEERRDKDVLISWPCVWMRHYLNAGTLFMRERSDR